MKAPDRESVVMVNAIAQRAKEMIQEIERSSLDFGQKKSQTTNIIELRNKRVKSLYKRTIRKHKAQLEKMNLNENEKITLEYLDINPRLMLIIDDCSEQFQVWMKSFKKTEANIFEAIFYRGRWNYITLIFACHDDKIVTPPLRKNSRVTMYTNANTINACVGKPSSGFSAKDKKAIAAIAEKVFGDENSKIKTHQKLCIIRDDPHQYRYTIANLYPEFSLVTQSMAELIDKMPKKERATVHNPFLKEIVQDKPKKKLVSNKVVNKKKIRLKYD
jgi:hypothetical protein